MPKAVDILVNSVLPPDLRGEHKLDKKNIDRLMADIARSHPEQYTALSKRLSDIGRMASYIQGETITLSDMKAPFDKDAVLAKMDQELDTLNHSDKLTGKALEEAKIDIYSRYATDLKKMTQEAALRQGNNIASAVTSGSRGNPDQLQAMLTTPALYTDYKDRLIPLFVRRSFGEGLRPAEYLAGTYGVRKAVLSTKNATAKAGDVSKQMQQSTAHLVVSEDDCGSSNGVEVDVDDPDLQGRFLARSYGNIKANTPVDKKLASELRRRGIKDVVARSVLTCQARNGICAHDLGMLPEGHLAPIGYSAGVTAAQAIGEPLAQGSLNVKHGGGMFRSKKQVFAGFNILNQVLQSPETFPYKAAVAETDGRVTKIEDAPQGGKYLFIGDQQHYALPGYAPTVQVGDEVEAGDKLSEGLIDVSDIARLRGLGEARQTYVKQLKQILEDSNSVASKRNLEMLARGALDHVRIDDDRGMGMYLPDDVVSYNELAAHYSPPKEATPTDVKRAIGQHLYQPALHYTIGTRITPRIAKHLAKNGYERVLAAEAQPAFTPEMVRLRGAQYSGDDWLAKMHTSLLGQNLEHDAARGRDTNVEHNTHFAPRLMVGKDFGKNVGKTGEF